MCGRYVLKTPFRKIAEALDSLFPEFELEQLKPRFNIAPSQPIATVRLNANGERVLTLVRWGLIPSWSKEEPKIKPINARSETATTSRMFRPAMDRRRCLIAADGFYEWQKLDEKRKQPMYIRRQDNGVFAFAGLWERWKPSEDTEPIDTCTILTTTPNELMSPIHDRMPVIVAPADYERWLDRSMTGKDVADLLKPAPAAEMEASPVSTHVNLPRNDSEACIASLA